MGDMTLVYLWFIVAIVFGGSIVLIPLVSLSLRFAFKPLLEMYLAARSAQTLEGGHEEDRLDRLEAEVKALRQAVARLAEAEEFRHELASSTEQIGPPADR